MHRETFTINKREEKIQYVKLETERWKQGKLHKLVLMSRLMNFCIKSILLLKNK